MFDWNNHKAMPKEKLLEEFRKLPLDHKISVFRDLKHQRRILLKKEWKKWFKQEHDYAFRGCVEIILSPHREIDYLKDFFPNEGFLDLNLIKTDDELKLTYEIFKADEFFYSMGISKDNPNRNTLDSQFESLQKKMIKMLHDTDPQTEVIKQIKYTLPPTSQMVLDDRKEEWLRMYAHIGTSARRAKKIVSAYNKKIKYYRTLPYMELREKIINLVEWDNIIKKEFGDFSSSAKKLHNKVAKEINLRYSYFLQ